MQHKEKNTKKTHRVHLHVNQRCSDKLVRLFPGKKHVGIPSFKKGFDLPQTKIPGLKIDLGFHHKNLYFIISLSEKHLLRVCYDFTRMILVLFFPSFFLLPY